MSGPGERWSSWPISTGVSPAVVLGIVALLMFGESIRRLLRPEAIQFAQALPIAIVGLLVNLVSVKLLDADDHADGGDEHHHHHHDHNLRAAYFHVLADAFTSVLAIAALVSGRYAGWTFLYPLMGIVGGAVILRWSVGLCRGAARQLLDMVSSPALAKTIRKRLEVGDVRVATCICGSLLPDGEAARDAMNTTGDSEAHSSVTSSSLRPSASVA